MNLLSKSFDFQLVRKITIGGFKYMMFDEKLYLKKSKGFSFFYTFIGYSVTSAFREKWELPLGKMECLSCSISSVHKA